MSYAVGPETNPYVAPRSDVAFEDFGRTAAVGYAGFWRRVAAYIIDYFLVAIFSIIGGFILGLVLGGVGAASNNPQLAQNLAFSLGMLLGLGVAIGYYAGFESSASQATPGKMALGIKVTDLNGRRITFGRGVGRLLSKILSGLILGIGFIMVAFTERKQGLHDILAGTLVVRTR